MPVSRPFHSESLKSYPKKKALFDLILFFIRCVQVGSHLVLHVAQVLASSRISTFQALPRMQHGIKCWP